MSKNRTIVVLAAVTLEQLESNGCDVEDTHCQTLPEARRRARYYLTEEYMRSSESTTMLGYSRVLVNGECEYDFFGGAK